MLLKDFKNIVETLKSKHFRISIS